MKNLTLNIEMKISEEKISELLSTAFYGGINYWAFDFEYEIPQSIIDMDLSVEDSLAKSLIEVYGYSFVIIEDEDDNAIHHKIDIMKIKRGLEIMAKVDNRFNDFLEDGFDAEIADITMQYICFGEIIYG